MSNYYPLVSVGMPVYNGEKRIRRALDSLLAQDHEYFELIISDNASTDRTGEICQRYAQDDNRIRYFRNETNQGAVWNFKRVLELAHGEYFMWAAHDDEWKPEFVRLLVEELDSHTEVGVAMSAVDLVREDGQHITTIRFDGQDTNRLGHYQMMMRLTASGKQKQKYNLYFYGLFRANLLRHAMRYYVDTFIGDRLLICHFALATRFRYTDRILHIRTVHAAPAYRRYPEENFSQVFRRVYWTRFKSAFDLGQILWRSHLIPNHRKLYIPIAMWRTGWLIYKHSG